MAKCRHRRKFLLSNIDTRGYVMREMDHSIGNQRDNQDTVIAADTDDIQPWPDIQDNDQVSQENRGSNNVWRLRNGKVIK